jgi:hypothetical protein
MVNLQDKPPRDSRPSLLDVWANCRFEPSLLACEAKLSEEVVQAMLCNKPVTKEDAEKVLAQLSTLLQKDYSLNTVSVSLAETGAAQEIKSEVARVMQQIDAEYEAGRQALHGLALGTAQHAFITQRMENMANQFAALRAIIGEEEAMRAMVAWQDKAASNVQTEEIL